MIRPEERRQLNVKTVRPEETAKARRNVGVILSGGVVIGLMMSGGIGLKGPARTIEAISEAPEILPTSINAANDGYCLETFKVPNTRPHPRMSLQPMEVRVRYKGREYRIDDSNIDTVGVMYYSYIGRISVVGHYDDNEHFVENGSLSLASGADTEAIVYSLNGRAPVLTPQQAEATCKNFHSDDEINTIDYDRTF
jgi:hypothetical protein